MVFLILTMVSSLISFSQGVKLEGKEVEKMRLQIKRGEKDSADLIKVVQLNLSTSELEDFWIKEIQQLIGNDQVLKNEGDSIQIILANFNDSFSIAEIKMYLFDKGVRITGVNHFYLSKT